jgi:hypothetical protein
MFIAKLAQIEIAFEIHLIQIRHQECRAFQEKINIIQDTFGKWNIVIGIFDDQWFGEKHGCMSQCAIGYIDNISGGEYIFLAVLQNIDIVGTMGRNWIQIQIAVVMEGCMHEPPFVGKS